MPRVTQTPPAPDHVCASTHDVAILAQQQLRECPFAALRSVTCRFNGGVLILTGEVPTYYTKQIAQTLVRDLDQVEAIDNRLVVS